MTQWGNNLSGCPYHQLPHWCIFCPGSLFLLQARILNSLLVASVHILHRDIKCFSWLYFRGCHYRLSDFLFSHHFELPPFFPSLSGISTGRQHDHPSPHPHHPPRLELNSILTSEPVYCASHLIMALPCYYIRDCPETFFAQSAPLDLAWSGRSLHPSCLSSKPGLVLP